MISEFEIPLVCLIFVSILNIVYLQKERVKFIENKYYEIILISTLIINIINTAIHIICATYDFNYVVEHYSKLITFGNQIGTTLIVLTVVSLLLYTLTISYESIRKKLKIINIIAGIFVFSFFLITFKLSFTLVKLNYVTSGTGSLVESSYVLVIVLMLMMLITNLLNIRKLDRRHSVVFLIVLLTLMLSLITLIYPEFNIYDLILCLLCYLMYFTIENPDLKLVEEMQLAKDIAEKANKAKS